MINLLIKGENRRSLEYLLDHRGFAEKVDLVYIDPPFATGGDFTITDERSATISKSKGGEIAYSDRLRGNDYLAFLRARFDKLRHLLSKQGSIYVHIDYKIGHYVKILMDEVFGVENFRNDITRVKCNPKNFSRIGYGNVKDMVLFYSKTSHPIWNEPRIKYTKKDIEKLFSKIDKKGRRYTTVPIHAPGETVNGKSNEPFNGMRPPKGRHWRAGVETLENWDRDGLIEWSSTGNPRKKLFADGSDGKRMQDIWDFKDPQYPIYPTEKNADMLDMIVRTSSNPQGTVLDCFCGSGTTLQAAHLNDRNWVGIDESGHAIRATRERLEKMHGDLFNSKLDYEFVELFEKLDTSVKQEILSD